MKQFIWEKARANSLFLKIVSILVLSVICVSALTMSVAIRASEDVYINTFSRSNSQVIGQIGDNLLDFNDRVVNVMDTVNQSWAFRRYLTSNDHTSVMASYTIYSMILQLDSALTPDSSDKMNIMVLGLNGSSYVGDNAVLTMPTVDILQSPVTHKALANPRGITYQFIPQGFTSLTKNDSVIIASKVLLSPDSDTPYGVVFVMIGQPAFQSFYSSFSNSSNRILLIDRQGNVVSADDARLIQSRPQAVQDAVQQIKRDHVAFVNTTLDSRNVTIIQHDVENMGYSIVDIIDREAVLNEVGNSKSILLIGSAIALLVIIIVFYITRKTTTPISKLVRQVPEVIQGNFSTHIPVEGSYEAQRLSTAFNYMLDGLNSYVNQLMMVQSEKRKAEIHALQMQINPHFVYNTLTSIKWLIWQGESERSCQTIDAFIALLRSTISNRQEMIPVAEELKNLENYVYLQQIRYGDTIKAHFFPGEGCAQCLIPKMILQPFVENSFFHAFQGAAAGNIYLYVNRRGDDLICELIDDGIGISPEQMDTLLAHEHGSGEHFSGIGINNVNDRLKLLYGERYGVDISSEPGGGTMMTVRIPVVEEEEAVKSTV